ncbi:nuclear transport factor 2 family protein [Roseospira goensis]|uniref:SnoaL-like domain-containing protein n=1 Tax=Roseospira goensis TaxID=391922 RepID=A0A7W6RYR8_9PROT|nr:nuclear transport factor 2 family protein [Roseospira goensis]MBB4285069.1 hypothetical protein [Roseospira goensis]
MLDTWHRWIAAFNQACEADAWSALDPFLTDDVVYIVAGVPFACELRGRKAVIAGFQRSVRGFDQHFERRTWTGVGVRLWEPGTVTARALGRYTRAGAPDLTFAAHGTWVFRHDRIAMMLDLYDPAEADIQAAMAWLGEHGADLDPSYA